ncbi:MAG: hypothetical protein M1835_000263, partial [Candelina submexicana]
MAKAEKAATTPELIFQGMKPAHVGCEEQAVSVDRHLPTMVIGEAVIVADETFSKSQDVENQ